MALSVVFDGTQLASGGSYAIDQAGADWGAQAVADALLTGQLRPEEIDQAAAEMNLQRVVTLPVRIKAANADALRTLQQTLTASLGRASKYAPLTMTVIPDGSTHVSTFKVWGGSWQAVETQTVVVSGVLEGVLTLQCQWPVYGAAQNLGSSGSPGDSTILFAELLRQKVPNGLVILYDPESVERCVAAGVGTEVNLWVGGKSDREHAHPVACG